MPVTPRPFVFTLGLVSSAPPRKCGIATYSKDLADAIMSAGDPDVRVQWTAIETPEEPLAYPAGVQWTIRQGDPGSYRAAAQSLNLSGVDVVHVQHEFGLYGAFGEGYDDHLEGFWDAIRLPVITTLHSVLPEPTPAMRAAVQRIARHSSMVIGMAERARELLLTQYSVPAAKVRVIPHGVPPVSPLTKAQARQQLGWPEDRPIISTFGLLDPRKGLEYAIRAMQAIVARVPDALYLVLGASHPEVVRRTSDRYRHELERLVGELGLTGNVQFVNRYLTQAEIVSALRATDLYVTPYLDPNQITSGTLAYALGAGKAVVSTPYPHAAEALADGRGVLVPFRDADALGDALLRLLVDGGHRAAIEQAAFAWGSQAFWPAVGQRMLQLSQEVLLPGGATPKAAAPLSTLAGLPAAPAPATVALTLAI